MPDGHTTRAAIRVAAGHLRNFYAGRIDRAGAVRNLRALHVYATDAGDGEAAEISGTLAGDLDAGLFPVCILDGENIDPPEGFQEDDGDPLAAFDFSPAARERAEGLTAAEILESDVVPSGEGGRYLVEDVKEIREQVGA